MISDSGESKIEIIYELQPHQDLSQAWNKQQLSLDDTQVTFNSPVPAHHPRPTKKLSKQRKLLESTIRKTRSKTASSVGSTSRDQSSDHNDNEPALKKTRSAAPADEPLEEGSEQCESDSSPPIQRIVPSWNDLTQDECQTFADKYHRTLSEPARHIQCRAVIRERGVQNDIIINQLSARWNQHPHPHVLDFPGAHNTPFQGGPFWDLKTLQQTGFIHPDAFKEQTIAQRYIRSEPSKL